MPFQSNIFPLKSFNNKKKIKMKSLNEQFFILEMMTWIPWLTSLTSSGDITTLGKGQATRQLTSSTYEFNDDFGDMDSISKIVPSSVSNHTFEVKLQEPFNPNTSSMDDKRRYLGESGSGFEYCESLFLKIMRVCFWILWGLFLKIMRVCFRRLWESVFEDCESFLEDCESLFLKIRMSLFSFHFLYCTRKNW